MYDIKITKYKIEDYLLCVLINAIKKNNNNIYFYKFYLLVQILCNILLKNVCFNVVNIFLKTLHLF